MRLAITLLGLFCCGGFLWADDKADKKPDEKKEAAFDAAKLVGKWKIKQGHKMGDEIEKDRLSSEITITKDEIHIPAGPEEKFIMSYKLNTKKTPIEIDMEIKDGPVKEGKAAGIIELKGDELKLCYNPFGERPTKFESTTGNAAFYFVLARASK